MILHLFFLEKRQKKAQDIQSITSIRDDRNFVTKLRFAENRRSNTNSRLHGFQIQVGTNEFQHDKVWHFNTDK